MSPFVESNTSCASSLFSVLATWRVRPVPISASATHARQATAWSNTRRRSKRPQKSAVSRGRTCRALLAPSVSVACEPARRARCERKARRCAVGSSQVAAGLNPHTLGSLASLGPSCSLDAPRVPSLLTVCEIREVRRVSKEGDRLRAKHFLSRTCRKENT